MTDTKSFKDYNEQIEIATIANEQAVRKAIEALENYERAEQELSKARTAKGKANLEKKLYSDNLNSVIEQSRNFRAESRI